MTSQDDGASSSLLPVFHLIRALYIFPLVRYAQLIRELIVAHASCIGDIAGGKNVLDENELGHSPRVMLF